MAVKQYQKIWYNSGSVAAGGVLCCLLRIPWHHKKLDLFKAVLMKINLKLNYLNLCKTLKMHSLANILNGLQEKIINFPLDITQKI